MAATSTKTRRTRPVRAVAEIVRERETFKLAVTCLSVMLLDDIEANSSRYDPSLVANSRYRCDGRLLPSSEITTASDSVLTALALLGTYQTRTKRGFISLFDSNNQYVIAEAAPEIPITSRLSSNHCSIPLSLCGTAIPRSQGTCDHVLYLPTGQESDDEAELPLSFVPNLATDPRFSSRPYCQFGDSGQFYAGVPIRTRRGINIGAYCVMSPVVPDDWDDRCTRYLRDISNAIMEHLECNRSRQAYWRSERLNRGLSSFMQGKAALTRPQFRDELEPFMDQAVLERSLNSRSQHTDCQEKDDALKEPIRQAASSAVQEESTILPWSSTVVNTPGVTLDSKLAGAVTSVTDHQANEAPKLDSDDSSRVYSRAANVIREAFEVDGCAFFDVTFGSYNSSPGYRHREKETTDNHTVTLTSSSDEQARIPATSAATDVQCDMLGFSTRESSSINGAESIKGIDGSLPKSLLAKLLRRYPNGKIFSFDAIGELQSSDSSEDDDAFETHTVATPLTPRQDRDNKSEATGGRNCQRQRHKLKEGALIHQAFPSARCVAFIPVWDWKGERWFAGGFVYTLNPSRVFSVEGELSILWAFARLIATEVLSVEAAQADKAKSDALGSLSHELRSPLHGVILGTELLKDTDLTVFQENTMRTIETCCRTLLDTVDHLLDYSKVNSLTAKTKQRASTLSPQLRKSTRSDHFGKKNLYSNMRLDCLVEEVAESVFAGFSHQQMSVQQLSDSSTLSTHNSITRPDQLHPSSTTDQPGSENVITSRQGLQFGDVAVYLSIDPTCSWMFYLPAGAIRRIVMNLFGNSLKYTSKGTIEISLTQVLPNSWRPKTERVVRLTVQDTGKGMSEDFLKHKLFRPFSQEDELAPGTGLGLSLVKKILSQLHGSIHVDSQAGVGTSVVVTLPLELSRQHSDSLVELSHDDTTFEEQIRELTSLRVCISGFGSEDSRHQHTMIEAICRRWLHLELVSDAQTAPDVILWSDNALPELPAQITQLAKTPNVVVCRNALAAHQRSIAYERAGHGGVFEFISQPIGSRKLAKSILLTYKRWMGLPRASHRSGRPSPSRASSMYTGQPISGLEIAITKPSAEPEKVNVQLMAPAATINFESCTGISGASCCHEEAPPESETHVDHTSKILIVDDNPINLTVLSAYMNKLGWSYEAVTNGKEAVDTYMEHPGHFIGILMDISMPVMDGLEATRRIRAYEQDNQLQPVTIVALTGLSSESTHQEALGSGVDVFLTKPVRLKALSEVLEAWNIKPTHKD